tara:strand:+ start:22171 stop:22344 length:174 start_codon:yes stop_codon:yes gene_type:complete
LLFVSFVFSANAQEKKDNGLSIKAELFIEIKSNKIILEHRILQITLYLKCLKIKKAL